MNAETLELVRELLKPIQYSVSEATYSKLEAQIYKTLMQARREKYQQGVNDAKEAFKRIVS